MILREKLPNKYVPYQRVTICSNTLEGGGFLFEVDGKLPLLIGKGTPPLIWLSAMTPDGSKVVVDASTPASKDIVSTNVFGGSIVMLHGNVIISARETSANAVEIDQLDMRPLGFSIYGDQKALYVGGNTFSGNHFSGVATMFGIG